MEAAKRRIIKSGAQYDHLFPRAYVNNLTVKGNASVSDTVAFIPKVVGETLNQTKGIAGVLKGRSDYETCRNIWQFVYGHIAYNKDRDGYEQIRSPSRAWHDRRAGVDCDCYTTFISSILANLGIRHKLRITKYSKDYFQHIYPIALLSGREVIIDCVTEQFDFEVPFTEKKDYNMELQYLNGIGGSSGNPQSGDGIAELGKLFKRKAKAKGSGGGKKRGKGIFKKIGAKLKKIDLKKALNVVNKLNPATIALRNGVLASMKINVGNVAKRLRWSYITAGQARAKKMDMGKWQRLVALRQKLEKIYYGAGGKPENLKKAILHGKGNKDGGVHGIGGLGIINNYGYHHEHPNHPLNRLNKYTPMRQLLGDEMFFSENSVGTLGELGEPVTMAMVTAASGVIAAIAASLKKIGDLFHGKGKDAKDFDEDTNKEAEKEIPEEGTATAEKSGSDEASESKSPGSNRVEKAKRFEADDSGSGSSNESSGGSGSEVASETESTTIATKPGGSAAEGETEEGTNGGAAGKAVAKKESGDDGGDKEGFWDKNKNWIVPTGVGVAGLALAAALFAGAKKGSPPARKALNGVPKNKAKKTVPKKTATKKAAAKKATPRKGKGKVAPIKLM